ncbi:MAG TPA: transglutaminase domain-containing protein [Candidatus Fermentibacter daniensis]|jgi:hypothetical protein|nr:MAG: hypothetical protein AO396_07175 [Candidatus Fermentibacter daniensis]MBP7720705.1 transglutaminase domain-containing protein [Candidatus Fermentibacter sp.]OQC69013.1 MAG: Transglutaminase-like superfamily protein [candidate division Hyd24-12 bacterium ADurb.Bin004]KZD15038.1 MAG: hypothetical protein AO395_06855 [Candidatus Fermentibacter daniensis]KZD18397.1 MAG: hypothetical protein AO394_00275 [Candidatus Fermentibacter daniensis]
MTIVSILFLLLPSAVQFDDALEFLSDNSPLCDLVPAYAEILSENVRLALLARGQVSWGALVPDSVFLDYVLPVRVSQEPVTDWRPQFFAELLPLVADAPGIEAAAVRVLAWCDANADFMQTQRRDQSPLVTLASGTGRCEELTILQMDALRSVCIPCRQVYTPWWMTCDNNHAWTEVWTPEGWVATESGLGVDSLDQPTWFSANASRSAVVVAVVQDSVPGALLRRGHASLLNITSNYADTGFIRTEGSFGGPVYVSIVNWGALRPVTRLVPGVDSLELGCGTYMLSWGWPVSCLTVEVTAGETVVVTPVDGGPLPGSTMLNVEEEH